MVTCVRPRELTSMSIWILGMMCEEDLLTRVPLGFPTPEDGDFVSELLRRPNFERMLVRSAESIRHFAETRLGGCISGEEFIRKMRKYVAENSIIPGYVPR